MFKRSRRTLSRSVLHQVVRGAEKFIKDTISNHILNPQKETNKSQSRQMMHTLKIVLKLKHDLVKTDCSFMGKNAINFEKETNK